MEDEWLVRQWRDSRNPRLFELLVERHRGPVLRLVLGLLGPRRAADAEDLAQETFVRAYEGLAEFRGESGFSTWLYRIAYNVTLDHLRRAARRPLVALDESPPDRFHAPDESALERLAGAQRARLVRDGLDELPPPYRVTLALYYWLEVPVEEIAPLLGVSPGTVKSYLFRGRARLDRILRRRGTLP